MYQLVYTNRRLLGFLPVVTPAFWVLVGAVLCLAAAGLLGHAGLRALGIVVDSADRWVPSALPAPWKEGLVGVFVGVLGLIFIHYGAGALRRASQSRAYLGEGGPLAQVEGVPLFDTQTEDGSRQDLTVGGRLFDLRECSRRGARAVQGYRWGQSTSMRGRMRVWYIPTTGLLLRAEWRSFTADEVRAEVEEIINRAASAMVDETTLRTVARGKAAVEADLRRIVQSHEKQMDQDCDQLRALLPDLLPGASDRTRQRAEELLVVIRERIDFTRKAVADAFARASR